jgi:hypothetical protein
MKRSLSSIEPPPTWPARLAEPARPSLAAFCLDAAGLLAGLALLGFVAWQMSQHSILLIP